MKTLTTLVVAICLAGTAWAQQPSPPPKPSPEHQKLTMWLGDWTYEGQAYATPVGGAEQYVGKATARLILGGFFVEWRGELQGPSGHFQWYALERYDAPPLRARDI